MADAYPWLKAVHIVAVVAWMAGVLYLPRLFVYHTRSAVGSEASETFKVMERRLMHAITVPAATITWVFGIILLSLSGYMVTGWFQVKLALVVLMTFYTFVCELWRRDLLFDRRKRSDRFYRIANEVPTLLLIGIVIMVVVKPF